MNVGEIFVNMKDEIFHILHDLITLKFKSLFTKNNRLFYLGLFTLIICLILYLLSKLIAYSEKLQIKQNLITNSN